MRLLRNQTLLAVSVAVGAAYTGIGLVGPVRILYAQSRGASLAIISAMASAFLLSNFAAQYPSGWLADRFGRRRVLVASLLVQAALSLVYLPITDPGLFVALRVVEGLAAAAVLPAARALVADAVPNERRGEAYGDCSRRRATPAPSSARSPAGSSRWGLCSPWYQRQNGGPTAQAATETAATRLGGASSPRCRC